MLSVPPGRSLRAFPSRHGTAILAAAFLIAACSVPLEKKKTGPTGAVLVLDVPRREAAGITERWMVVQKEKTPYLLHSVAVERRRTRQHCGRIGELGFTEGWDALEEAGLLVPGEDLRLIPPPGSPAFASRLRLSFLDAQGKRVKAMRPLDAAETEKLLDVLGRWKAALQPEERYGFPPLLRVEMGVEGCELPGRKRRRAPERSSEMSP